MQWADEGCLWECKSSCISEYTICELQSFTNCSVLNFFPQDLLQLQYEGVAVMKMFNRAKVNVNLLIFLLNRKFYGKHLAKWSYFAVTVATLFLVTPDLFTQTEVTVKFGPHDVWQNICVASCALRGTLEHAVRHNIPSLSLWWQMVCTGESRSAL